MVLQDVPDVALTFLFSVPVSEGKSRTKIAFVFDSENTLLSINIEQKRENVCRHKLQFQ